ncbi:TonB-dependent receptor [Methylobacillus flagellatus]|uniref:TonB-dependent receptor domain-containing protein n=1 Tax=Methylobacillus flagellatus TaxID=405 RepID=UPI002853F277|nr:TonB-dependent receptor [Methylobacillus flagellatus]MDR5171547.1 TonB-dependent receptor [Methylobacillus flagellatus]
MKTFQKPGYFRIACAVMLFLPVLTGLPALAADQQQTTPAVAVESTENKSTFNKNERKPSTTRPSSKPLPPEATVLPEVGVSASRIKQDAVTIDRTQTITTIEAKELERTQPATIFEAVQNVPGVTFEGGPRPSGMSFNVRGFADNEDVQVRVDGIPKSFEKYRFGGTFAEPELLKSIEVQRGPQISSGSGSIGGTVLLRTKDAADLLKPGQRYGARLKFGYASNNDEFQKSYLVYARPHDAIDILYNRAYRNSNDITHADGSKLEASNVDSTSQLLKISIFPTDTLELSTSAVLLEESGLQQYDAIGANPDLFGNVVRTIEDYSISETIRWNPNHPWINLVASVGKGHTKMDDNCYYAINVKCTRNLGTRYDHLKFKSTTIDIANTADIFKQDTLSLSLLTGLQHRSISKEISRTYSQNSSCRDPLRDPNYSCNDGFWAASVSGKNTYSAFYVQPRLQIDRLGIIPGVRIDWYEMKTLEPRVKNHLAEKGLSDSISFTHKTYSLGLTFDLIPRQLTLFGNYAQGFRPPSTNEYFSYSSAADFPYNGYDGGEGNCATPSTNYICGDVYKLQKSESREIGLSYENPRLFNSEVQLISKLTYFEIDTDHLLRSFSMDPTTGIATQDGKEKRKGNEFEGSLLYRDFYARVSFSNTWGTEINNEEQSAKLYRIPAKTFNLTMGTQILKNLGFNISYRKVSPRMAYIGTSGLNIQDGYEIFNAGLYWIAAPNLAFRLVGENIKNKDYYLNASGDLGGFQGNRAAGRNIRFITEISF